MLYNNPVINQVADVIIIGGGPAGLTAGIYCSRASLSTVVLAGNPPGGQLMWTTDVENYPGFPNGIQGPQLIEDMRKQAQRFGAKVYDVNVLKVKGSFSENFVVFTDSFSEEEKVLMGRTLIVASGASAKWLGLESEQRLKGKGVSACATCDGFFFKDKVVAVVGGGDAAMEEAIFLTKFAKKVYVLVRKGPQDVKASKIMYERAKNNPKIDFKYNTEVVEVLGETKVSGIKVINNLNGEVSVFEDVEGLFVAIGHKPNVEFLFDEESGESFIEIGKHNYVVLKEGSYTQSSKEGVFVAGDVADYKYRQAVTAAGFGCMAALDCISFLSGKERYEQ